METGKSRHRKLAAPTHEKDTLNRLYALFPIIMV